MKKRISKKTLLHDEVQSRISKMLHNKNILYKNNPVDNTETNAKLIKSFLYRKISSKYPKYNSFTKISTIHNLNDTDLSNLLLDLPNLDEWYASIQQYKEKQNANRKNQSHVFDEEEDAENEEEIIEADNNTVETVNTTIETVNTTIETVNTEETFTKSNSNENDELINDKLTNDESNELSENFNLTDKIIGIVGKIVIVYAFYRLAKWFI